MSEKTWLPWCQDEGPSSHSCYYVGWSRKAPSWQKLRKLEQNTKVFWVCGLIFIVLSGLVSQCGPFTRDDQLGPFFVVSVLLVLVFNKFFFSQNLMLTLQVSLFSEMPRKRWTWLRPVTCVIPVRRWSWKARWKNTDFLLLEQRQNKGMVAKLKIFDLIGNRYFVWFFLDSNNNDQIWFGEMSVFPLKPVEIICCWKFK